MKTVKTDIKIKEVLFRDEKIFFSLEDGREIGAPLKWYPKLYNATEEELQDYKISPGGYGVHWNKVDEDLSAYGMLTLNQEINSQLL
ncbi:DUF2442 domain-containing protein [Salinimicrobium sp. HB62]|uniref:DUF2442 domain-containing protein n=1 Tax=Salinimicrobium sp. HB62 TaxID=3077781 RepID=UPI002D7955F1|nr:DUF2442 domain-containing protein [Salinimicrobium sp. HB62]